MEIPVIFVIVPIWAIAIAAIIIMRKIQPEDKIYPVWAVTIAACLTVFVLYRQYQGQDPQRVSVHLTNHARQFFH